YAEAGAGDDRFGVAPVARPARELRGVAEVFLSRLTIGARATGAAQPRDADARPDGRRGDARPERLDNAHNLVARGHLGAHGLELAVDHVQVRAAHRAG